ncbi:MAG: hypothetical protein K6C36_07485 [Clostridia bacterium]|nr:hypothetical protein [Clostridia bacterium]
MRSGKGSDAKTIGYIHVDNAVKHGKSTGKHEDAYYSKGVCSLCKAYNVSASGCSEVSLSPVLYFDVTSSCKAHKAPFSVADEVSIKFTGSSKTTVKATKQFTNGFGNIWYKVGDNCYICYKNNGGKDNAGNLKEHVHCLGKLSETVPPTCVSEGTGTRTCSECGKKISEQIPVDRSRHEYVRGVCKYCKSYRQSDIHVVSNSVIPLGQHRLIVKTTDAKIRKGPYKACDVVSEPSKGTRLVSQEAVSTTAFDKEIWFRVSGGYIIYDDVKLHDTCTYNDVITDPPCDKDGEMIRTCSVCHYEVTVTIPKRGHSYDKDTHMCKNGCGKFDPKSIKSTKISKNLIVVSADAFSRTGPYKTCSKTSTSFSLNQQVSVDRLVINNKGKGTTWYRLTDGSYMSSAYLSEKSDIIIAPGDTYTDQTAKVSFTASGNAGETEIRLNAAFLSGSSEFYNHDLARFCSQLCLVGYGKKDEIRNMLYKLGFDNNNVVITDAGRDQENCFIGYRDIVICGEHVPLIVVASIGSNGLQWNSNFDPYGLESKTADKNDPEKGKVHLGFKDAKNFVRGNLDTYLSKLQSKGINTSNAKFVLTGHSRGAAATNLLAAELLRLNTGNPNYPTNPNNIYAYTFATPNAIYKDYLSEIGTDAQKRIFNIVNPEDFVTKVLLAQWGFTRYGTTLSLPSKTNIKSLSEYNSMLKSMNSQYALFTSGKSYYPYPDGELSVYNIISEMNREVHGLEDYYSKSLPLSPLGWHPYEFFQNTLCHFVNKQGKEIKGLINIGRVFIANSQKVVVANGPSDSLYNPYNSLYKKIIVFFLTKEVAGHIGDMVASGAFNETDLESDLAVFFDTDITNNTVLQRYFTEAHMMETYCAFMMSLPENEIKERDGLYGTNNCPVDIEIYDVESGDLVGRIVDNQVDEEVAAQDDSVVMAVNGDEKMFWLPGEGNYDVRFIGNDTGVMDYTICKIDSDGNEVSRRNFLGVELEDGKVYQPGSEMEAEFYEDSYLQAEAEEPIEPEFISADDEDGKLVISAVSGGNGSVSGEMIVTKGDYVDLYAIPDEGYSFDGWYEEDIFVSDDPLYRFCPDKNVSLTGKFAEGTVERMPYLTTFVVGGSLMAYDPDSVVTIGVRMQNADWKPGAVCKAKLDYDPTLLQLVGIEEGGLYKELLPSDDVYSFSGSNITDGESEGTLLYATFKPLDCNDIREIYVGAELVSFKEQSPDGDFEWIDEILNKVPAYPMTVIPWAIPNEPKVTRGDFDGNGSVEIEDAIYLVYYKYAPERYPINQSGDLDGNGEVTIEDAIYLVYYKYAPDRYPLSS